MVIVMYDLTLGVIKKSKKEVVFKFITSIFLRSLLMVIPIFWSNTINYVTEGLFKKSYYLIVVILIMAVFYYIWQYINQVSWYGLYNKLYREYGELVLNDNKVNNLTVAEYTNIINNDIDIICTVIGNMITRIIQVLEFLVIYLYFLSLNVYIFIITVIISVIMLVILLFFGNLLQEENLKRKSALDSKTVTTHKMYEVVKNDSKGVSEEINNAFKQSNSNYLKNNTKFNLLSSFAIYFVLGMIEVCRYGIVFYSIYLITSGKLELGTLILIYTYYDKIIANFEVLGTINTEYQSFVVSLKRLNKVGS